MATRAVKRPVKEVSDCLIDYVDGVAVCACGWRGVPNNRDGYIMCPSCQSEDYPEPVAKPGRNDPCLCGSGKKYKKCCG